MIALHKYKKNIKIMNYCFEKGKYVLGGKYG